MLTLTAPAFSQKSAVPADNVIEEKTIRFYPNPASSTITFEFREVERGSVLQVYSFLGRQVISMSVSGNRITLNVNDLNKGIYIFQLKGPNGRIIETNKFQVSR